MSKIEVDAIEPQSGTTLTIGASGDTITIPSGATLSSTDPLVFPAGTVSLPAITTTGDTNTGIFFPAADTIAFSEGGAEAMRITSDGRLGIGTTTPTEKLSVDGSVIFNESGNNVDFRVEGDTDANLLFVDASTDRVGIGTASPPYKFTVDAGSDTGMGRIASSLDGGNTTFYVGNLFVDSGSIDEKTALTFLLGNNASAIGAYKVGDGATAGARDTGIEIFTQNNNSTTVQFRIDNLGNITATDTSIGAISDERLKQDITDFTYNLDTFKSLKPRTFNWKNPWLHGNETNRRGFIAQELENVDSYWVSEQRVSKKPDDILEEATYYEEGDEIPEGKKVGDVKTETTYSYKYEKGDGSDYDILNDGSDLNNIEMIAKLGKKDAMYVSVIQQLITKIESLEAKVTALETQP
jgi:hypothetical protein